ncbi:MAG: antitoxin [Candidatus Lokiarchaeota archaeon]|nr:antitoxin [Candidatus Lokiarchaeota archaeon]
MKTITIRDEVYNFLKEVKRPKESFSDVIIRLLKNKNIDNLSYFGVLKDSQILDEIESITIEIRESARERI